MPEPTNAVREEVKREFPPIGKYRIRLLRNPKTKNLVLDIREYVSSEHFQGFTRRGVRISDKIQAGSLLETLKEVVEEDLLAGA